jgi:phage protein U
MMTINPIQALNAAFGFGSAFSPVAAAAEDVAALYDAFGPGTYNTSGSRSGTGNGATYQISTLQRGDEAELQSYLGTPILMGIEIGQKSYTIREGGVQKTLTFGGIQLPPTSLMTLNRAKKIVTSSIAGRDGEVTEYMGMADWSIKIQGLLFKHQTSSKGNRQPPMEELYELRQLNEAKTSLPIYNKVCERLGIYEIIILSCDIQQVTAMPGVLQFSLDCKSEQAFELKLRR